MTAGKLLHSITVPGAVQSITVNPSEFVIGVITKTGIVSVYDLQSFEVISQGECLADKILFSNDGSELLASCKDSLKFLSWEPIETLREMPAQWTQSSDMSDLKIMSDNDNVVACCSTGSLLQCWIFPLTEVLIVYDIYFCIECPHGSPILKD